MNAKKIPYSRQSISKSDIKRVVRTLKSDFLTTGPEISNFEKKITKYLNVKYAVCVNSATSALHISCMILGLKKNDEFWTSTNSFVASANCGVLCGAKLDLIDISLNDFNLSIENLVAKLKRKKKPKIVIPVHLAGYPCDLKKINLLSKKYKFKILEDASHAFGSVFMNNKIGNCKYSDIAVFSFHPVKIFTSGEGGVLVTNNKNYYKKALMLRNHGITRDKSKYVNKNNNGIYYEQQLLGYNYRLSDLHASLGLSQLEKIDRFYNKRLIIKKRYDQKLKDLPFIFPKYKKKIKFSNHLYILMIDPSKTNKKRDDFVKYLRKKNIITSIHYIPIHKQPYYQKNNFKSKEFSNSNFYYDNAISLPIFPDLTKQSQEHIIYSIKSFFKTN